MKSLTYSSLCKNVLMTLNPGWRRTNLNDDKTEAMIVSSGRKSRSPSSSYPDFISVGFASVSLSDSVKNLAVTLNCYLTMKTHVSNLVRSANFELRRISSIRHLLSTEATKTFVSAFVFTSRLLQLFSFRLSSLSPKQTTEGSEQSCSPCPVSF